MHEICKRSGITQFHRVHKGLVFCVCAVCLISSEKYIFTVIYNVKFSRICYREIKMLIVNNISLKLIFPHFVTLYYM